MFGDPFARRHATRTLALSTLLAFALTACQVNATPTPQPEPTTPAGEAVACAPSTRVVTATGTPALGQADTEAAVRARLGPLSGGQIGLLLEARHVTVVGSAQDWEIGQDRWLLTFAYTPAATTTGGVSPTPGTAWRSVALADTITGNMLAGCSGLLPVAAPPAP